MGALGRKLRNIEGRLLAFWCPGCDEAHFVRVSGQNGGCWTFDGNVDAPTFSPSVHVTNGHYVPGWRGPKCWCNAEIPGGTRFKCARCHSFVRGGRIEFLSDSTHALAGKTVELPDFPADFAC